MAGQLEGADVVIVPGYSVTSPGLSWPASFPGQRCAPSDILEGYQQLQSDARVEGKLLLLLDEGSARISKDSSVSWLLLGARRDDFQYGVDISLPAEPSQHCSGEAASQSFLEPLAHKRYLLSFKGSFQDWPLAHELAALHNDSWDVVVVDAANAGYDAEYLLWNSVFNLVLAKPDSHDVRFNEVVCSGGIPVAIADDSWVPPFDGFIRFSSYGFLFRDSDVSKLLPRLRDVLSNPAEVRLLREWLGCSSTSCHATQRVIIHEEYPRYTVRISITILYTYIHTYI